MGNGEHISGSALSLLTIAEVQEVGKNLSSVNYLGFLKKKCTTASGAVEESHAGRAGERSAAATVGPTFCCP